MVLSPQFCVRIVCFIFAQGGGQEARQRRDAVWERWQGHQRRILLVPQTIHLTFMDCDVYVTGFYHRSAGDKYDGEWVNHQRYGQCVYTWSSGEVRVARARETPCAAFFDACCELMTNVVTRCWLACGTTVCVRRGGRRTRTS